MGAKSRVVSQNVASCSRQRKGAGGGRGASGRPPAYGIVVNDGADELCGASFFGLWEGFSMGSAGQSRGGAPDSGAGFRAGFFLLFCFVFINCSFARGSVFPWGFFFFFLFLWFVVLFRGWPA